jgi:hypothetical protein
MIFAPEHIQVGKYYTTGNDEYVRVIDIDYDSNTFKVEFFSDADKPTIEFWGFDYDGWLRFYEIPQTEYNCSKSLFTN